MVIQDTSRRAVLEGLAKHINRVEEQRENERQKLIQYYTHSSTDQYVKEYFKGTSLAQIPVYTQALMQRVVNQRALVYKNNPEMICDDKYVELSHGLNQGRRQLEKLTFLLGTMAFRSKIYTDKLGYDQVPIFKPYFLPGESKPFGISYPLHNYGGARLSQLTYAVWTETRDGQPGEHFLYQDNKIIPATSLNGEINDRMINPYDILPFTFVHRSPQIAGEFWVEGATDIMKANHQLDIGMTELALAYRFDAVGIKWIKGVDEVEEMPSGTDKFIIIPHEADIGRLGSASLQQLIDTLKFMTEVPLQNNHLTIRWSNQGQAKSGEALKMENIDNIEQREASVEDIWRRWESDRFQVDKKLLDVHNIANISDDYSVNFAEPTIPMSQAEEREQWAWELDRGFVSPKDYFKWKNPDISDKELKERLDNIENMKAAKKESELMKALETSV